MDARGSERTVRLYLSSYRIGDHGERLLELMQAQLRACVIMNGMDAFHDSKRGELFERTAGDLSELGFDVEELDLRDYFDSSGDASDFLNQGSDNLVQGAASDTRLARMAVP